MKVIKMVNNNVSVLLDADAANFARASSRYKDAGFEIVVDKNKKPVLFNDEINSRRSRKSNDKILNKLIK
jgi:hypothetical protein